MSAPRNGKGKLKSFRYAYNSKPAVSGLEFQKNMATSSLTFPSGRRVTNFTEIKSSPALTLYSAQEIIVESDDDFGSAEETIRPIWLVISNQANEKTLQIWKDWARNVKDYFAIECREAAIIGDRLVAVLAVDDAKMIDNFPVSKGETFISALCDMALGLNRLGFAYKSWNWSNFVQLGNCWKLIPSPSLEQVSEPDVKQTLSRLGKWLKTIKAPFLLTQPAQSIVEMLASGQFPEEFSEEIRYEAFWLPLEQRKTPLQLNLTQDQNTVRLEWEWTPNGETSLLCTDGKKKATQGQFIWQDELDQYGAPLSNVPGINPIIDSEAGTAQWNRPQNNSRYNVHSIVPVIKRDNWYEWGTPVIVGGPEEANLQGAYFEKDSNEVVLTPYWSDDRNITKIYIVARRDRFAQNVNDVQFGIAPVVVQRRQINHPIRKQFNFTSKLYVVLFNAVTIGNKVYFSPGQTVSCRKIVYQTQS